MHLLQSSRQDPARAGIDRGEQRSPGDVRKTARRDRFEVEAPVGQRSYSQDNREQFPIQKPSSAYTPYSPGRREEPPTRTADCNVPVGAAQQATARKQYNKKPVKVTREPLFCRIPAASSKNIVIFGETGTGKSSLINMLSDNDVATVSSGALGCTFESARYPITIHGVQYTLWDSAGLNEGGVGSVPAAAALDHLRDLVEGLRDGISLLVYCIRGSRYRDVVKVNYDLFTEIICQGEVPVVIVVTGLENEVHMEDWWVENEKEFTMRNMHFADHACVTATKGKKDMFEEEYEESKRTVRGLIQKCCSDEAWAVDSHLWFSRIADRIRDYYAEYNGHSNATGVVMQDGSHNEGSKGKFALFGEMVRHLAKAASVMCEILSMKPAWDSSTGRGLTGDAMEEEM